MQFLGDFADDSTVRIFFTTNDGSGGAVAPSTAFEASDVIIYKNNSAIQKLTQNGMTMTSPFDSITGLHLIEIDCSNDTGDAGFWAVGNDYTAVLSPDETVDGQTIAAALGQWSIENRATNADVKKWSGTAVATPDTAGYPVTTIKDGTGTGEINTASGRVGVNLGDVAGVLGNANVSWVDGNDRVDVGQWLGNAATASGGGKPEMDVKSVNNDTNAAIRLALSAAQMIPATVDTVINTHTPTTIEFQCDDITESTADHYNGRIVIFTSGVLTGQATAITDYQVVGGIGQFTVEAMTDAPSNNDTLLIV